MSDSEPFLMAAGSFRSAPENRDFKSVATIIVNKLRQLAVEAKVQVIDGKKEGVPKLTLW